MATSTKQSQPQKKEELPYLTGEGSYNRTSGNKTLILVGTCILLVVFLTILSLVLLNQGRVMIK